MKYRFKHIVEYGGLRVVSALIRILPHRAALGAGWLLAFVVHHLLRFKVRTTQKRMRAVFGDRFNDRDYRRLSWLAFRNFIFSTIDGIRAQTITPAQAEQRHEYHAAGTAIRALLAEGRGLILAIPHMGSWEEAGIVSSLCGIPLIFIVGRQRNPLFDAYLTSLRSRHGNQVIVRIRGDDANAMQGVASMLELVQQLKSGKVLAILPDVRMPTSATTISFLGGSANVATGIGLFARYADIPILPVINTRRGWTTVICRPLAPIRPDPSLAKEDDIRRMTQLVFDVINREVQDDPSQWFWYNSRWILDPVIP